MKLIYLIRHATAEEGSYSSMFRDFDRQLISKGTIEASRVGKHLFDKGLVPQYVISSEALRAKETAILVAEQCKIPVEEIQYDENMYSGGPRAYLAAINQLPAEVQSVALVGHNPDITFFAEYLTRDDVGGNMKKASIVILELEESLAWQEISSKTAKFKLRIDA